MIEFARRFERVRNRLSLVDHQIVHALETNEIPAARCVRSTTRFLAQTLMLSPGEARQRVLAHGALHPRLTTVGEVLPPERPVLAAAQRDGSVSPGQAQVIITATEKLERLSHLAAVTPELVAEVEADLTGFAATFDPLELRRCAERVVECVDPDGVLADERAQQTLREVQLTVRKDGMYSLRGVLTPPTGAALSAVLLPLARRRPSCPAEGEIAGADDRDYPARLHDALAEAAQRLLRSGTLPMSGGVPATVLITVSEATVRADRGFGRCSDGSLVPVRSLSSWAGEAEVVTVSTTRTGGVLELGRQRRFASRHQILALIARDEACTFPGCDHPPQWCEHHHITEWQRGGDTDIGNLTLLCRYHHHRFEAHGWSCRMVDGLPHWIPPRWADPEQRPILNRRLRDRHLVQPTGSGVPPCPEPAEERLVAPWSGFVDEAGPALLESPAFPESEIDLFDEWSEVWFPDGEFETGEFETGEFETGEFETVEFEAGEFETGGFEADCEDAAAGAAGSRFELAAAGNR